MSFIGVRDSFRLKRLLLKEHYVFDDLDLNFCEKQDLNSNQIFFTTLIGPNGTGKSEILKEVLLLVRSLHNRVREGKDQNRSYSFRLEFECKGQYVCYTNYSTDSIILKPEGERKRKPKSKVIVNNKEVDDLSSYNILPKSIIAQSIMLTDKYIVPRNQDEIDNFHIYRYLGLRNRPQQASTRSYVRRTIDLIVENVHTTRFQEGLIRMVRFLSLSDDIEITYKTIHAAKFFNRHITVDILRSYYDEMERDYKERGKQPPYKLNNFRTLDRQKDLSKLVDFVNSLDSNGRLERIKRGSSVKKLLYNVANKDDQSFLKEEYEHLDDLRKIGLLTVPDIRVEKSKVAIQEMSSGEFHFFSTMVGLLAAVKENSLILVDEPEISLHPNWQMKYLGFMRELFSDVSFRGSHFIIATHSHFLISDLDGDTGKIIGLTKESGNIRSMKFDSNTYGWSAEQVLLDIFKVTTTRNYMVAERLGMLLDFIASEESTLKEVKDKFYDLELDKLKGLSKEDPMRTVYDTIIKEFVDV